MQGAVAFAAQRFNQLGDELAQFASCQCYVSIKAALVTLAFGGSVQKRQFFDLQAFG